MPKYIIKMSKDGVDRYFEWSTIVDAPTTYGLTLEEFHQYYRDEYGERGMEALPQRMARVEKHGTSAIEGHSVEHIIEGNRCAEWEKDAFPPKPPRVEADGKTYEDLSWTFDEIWEFYVTRRGDDDEEEDEDEPPPGWEFCPGSTTLCQPDPQLVSAMCRIFDAGPDPDDEEPLYTPVTLERAHNLHADLLAILQPR